MHIEHVEAVIKVTERCNINCDYCYVYHKGNDDFLARPAIMKRPVFTRIADFLANGVRDVRAKRLSVIFHGGEPLLLKKAEFSAFCRTLRERVPQGVSLDIGLQTNAILVDDEWINLFHEHRVFVSVSLDGPEDVHDKHRRDHRGYGTHTRVMRGLKMLQSAASEDVLPYPGVISVVDPESDARKIYRYFVDELGLKNISFHLPMDTHETGGWINKPALANYLVDLFDEWRSDDNPSIRIRMFEEIISHFVRTPAFSEDPDISGIYSLQHVTISTDGTIGVDELKPSGIPQAAYTVDSTSLLKYAGSQLSSFLRSMYGSIPTDCADCVWASYCGGGSKHGVAVNRWSDDMGFNTRSLICNPLKAIYAQIAKYLIEAGVSVETIESNLRLERHPLKISQPGPQMPKLSNRVEEVCNEA